MEVARGRGKSRDPAHPERGEGCCCTGPTLAALGTLLARPGTVTPAHSGPGLLLLGSPSPALPLGPACSLSLSLPPSESPSLPLLLLPLSLAPAPSPLTSLLLALPLSSSSPSPSPCLPLSSAPRGGGAARRRRAGGGAHGAASRARHPPAPAHLGDAAGLANAPAAAAVARRGADEPGLGSLARACCARAAGQAQNFRSVAYVKLLLAQSSMRGMKFVPLGGGLKSVRT